MSGYFYLAGAILFEVIGTMILPITQNFTRPFPSVVLGAAYLLSFYCLTFAVKTIPLAIAYASWSAVGVFLIALLSACFYKQTLPWQAILGLGFVIVGVILINIFSKTH